ncbi:acyl-CoA dehydrogenase family protein [Williamsia muralis]|uniref:Acyl-CoA dehydrogenase n=1 Tax=Williamsia marianensis TaxID=85044 RepID=A0A2G3PN03_WILMA|nr:acyl-CoA dehydrogenase family protein [Williamsia marianensis]PHV67151.1 acyl-CoA dehydrogenase [Williamsia marianensis]
MTYLTDDHLAIQESTRQFAKREIEPIAQTLDLEDKQIPDEVLAKMGALGLFGVTLPEEHGGLGLDTAALCVVTEELAKASLSVGSVIHRNSTLGHILHLYGTDEQRNKYLAGMATGDIMTSSSGTEPEAGSDAANIKTTAKRTSNGYVLNGTKQWTTFANRADLLFVYARTSNEHKHGGISLFMVEKPAGEFLPPNLTGTHIPTAGYHGMKSYSLALDDLEVPESALVGGVEGQGFRQLMSGYETARITFASRCIGLAQAAYEEALAYTQQRVQFGKPISNFQAVRFRLADMYTQIQAARSMTFSAAEAFDTGKRADLEAGAVKLFAAEMAHKVAWDALYLHGGNGYAIDSKVNRYWRDAGLLPIGEGTSDIQREIIARRILGER